MAFAIEGFYDQIMKNSEDYVKIKALYQVKVDGVRSDTELELRPCTEEDFEEFYPPALQSEIGIQRLKERGNLLCIADYSMLELHGHENHENVDFGRLAVILHPCNDGLEEGEPHPTNPNCELTLQKQIEYLEPLNFLVYYNNERLDLEEFEPTKKIKKESILMNQ